MFTGESFTGVKTRPLFLSANHCVHPHPDADSSEIMDDPPAPRKPKDTTSQAFSKSKIHRRKIFVYNDFQTGFIRMIPPRFLSFGSLFESGNLKKVEVTEKLEVSKRMFRKSFNGPTMTSNFGRTIPNSTPFAEAANAQQTAKVIHRSEIMQEYFLELNKDINTKGHIQWFHFAVSNTLTNVRYRFHIGNFTKRNSQFQTGMRPWMYSVKETEVNNTGWRRCGCDISYVLKKEKFIDDNPSDDDRYMRSSANSGKTSYELQFTLRFRHKDDTVYLAYCPPYTYTDLKNLLQELLHHSSLRCGNPHVGAGMASSVQSIAASESRPHVECEVLCRTLAGNNCYLITITNSRNVATDKQALDSVGAVNRAGLRVNGKLHVVVTARQHPGEANASWIMDGFLRWATGPSEEARLLRDRCIIKVLPMLNPDGVINGNYRSSLSGQDPNRVWDNPSPVLHPTIWHAKKLISTLQQAGSLMMLVDMHGHSRKNDVFFYGCIDDWKGKMKRLRDLRRRWRMQQKFDSLSKGKCHGTATPLAKPHVPMSLRVLSLPTLAWKLSRMGGYSIGSCRFNIQQSKSKTARVVAYRLGIRNAFTLESSFHCYRAREQLQHQKSQKLNNKPQYRLFCISGWRRVGAEFGNAAFQFSSLYDPSNSSVDVPELLDWLGSEESADEWDNTSDIGSDEDQSDDNYEAAKRMSLLSKTLTNPQVADVKHCESTGTSVRRRKKMKPMLLKKHRRVPRLRARRRKTIARASAPRIKTRHKPTLTLRSSPIHISRTRAHKKVVAAAKPHENVMRLTKKKIQRPKAAPSVRPNSSTMFPSAFYRIKASRAAKRNDHKPSGKATSISRGGHALPLHSGNQGLHTTEQSALSHSLDPPIDHNSPTDQDAEVREPSQKQIEEPVSRVTCRPRSNKQRRFTNTHGHGEVSAHARSKWAKIMQPSRVVDESSLRSHPSFEHPARNSISDELLQHRRRNDANTAKASACASSKKTAKSFAAARDKSRVVDESSLRSHPSFEHPARNSISDEPLQYRRRNDAKTAKASARASSFAKASACVSSKKTAKASACASSKKTAKSFVAARDKINNNALMRAQRRRRMFSLTSANNKIVELVPDGMALSSPKVALQLMMSDKKDKAKIREARRKVSLSFARTCSPAKISNKKTSNKQARIDNSPGQQLGVLSSSCLQDHLLIRGSKVETETASVPFRQNRECANTARLGGKQPRLKNGLLYRSSKGNRNQMEDWLTDMNV